MQGSTSSVWQPRSFWQRQPLGGQALPLHVMAPGSSSGGGGSSSGATGSAQASAAYRGWGMQRTSQDLGEVPAAGEQPGGNRAAAADGQGPQAAYDLLMRSITCMLVDKAHAFGLQLKPGSWTAAAWLVVFTAGVCLFEMYRALL